MYRPGFGDCFLLSFGSAAAARHVLIDFGAHMHGEIGTMEPIMDDIEQVTKKKLALVTASHAHRDHISGFGKFADRFAQFTVGRSGCRGPTTRRTRRRLR
jgi:glyoxylase-like metal-dependent hydrolase (beta-lactamase superfamily II)